MNPKIRIMIIDDEAIVCNRLKSSLEKSGYTVETFTESTRALHRLSVETFDVVVTDLRMPGIDGMVVFRTVKEHYPRTKIIIISGFATLETAKEAMKKGVYDFVLKPFKINDLKAVIEKAVHDRQLT